MQKPYLAQSNSYIGRQYVQNSRKASQGKNIYLNQLVCNFVDATYPK